MGRGDTRGSFVWKEGRGGGIDLLGVSQCYFETLFRRREGEVVFFLSSVGVNALRGGLCGDGGGGDGVWREPLSERPPALM